MVRRLGVAVRADAVPHANVAAPGGHDRMTRTVGLPPRAGQQTLGNRVSGHSRSVEINRCRGCLESVWATAVPETGCHTGRRCRGRQVAGELGLSSTSGRLRSRSWRQAAMASPAAASTGSATMASSRSRYGVRAVSASAPRQARSSSTSARRAPALRAVCVRSLRRR